MKTPTSKSLLTDSEVRKIYESRLPEYTDEQKRRIIARAFEPKIGFPESPKVWRNLIPRTIEEKRAIVYKMKAKYLNKKSV